MNELIPLEDIKAPVLFGSDDEVESLINRVQESARSIVCTIDTAKGRKEMASLAAKVARSKTYLDGLGKDLVADIKAQAKQIDNRRKTIRDTLDDLKEEVRKPLTDFEENEKARKAAHEENIDRLEEILKDIPISTNLADINGCIDHVADISSGDYEEYTDGRDRIVAKINLALAARKTELLEARRLAEENARLKKEAEELAQKERDERIAREAADAARREEERKREEADRKARAERDAEQRRLREAEEAKLQAERDALEAQRRELAAANKAAQDKLDSAEKRETERIAAIAKEVELERERVARQEEDEKRHQQEIEAAAQAERDRIAEEKRIGEEAAAAREADKAHRAKIDNEAIQCLIDAGVSKTAAKQAVTAIAQGKVTPVTIRY